MAVIVCGGKIREYPRNEWNALDSSPRWGTNNYGLCLAVYQQPKGHRGLTHLGAYPIRG